MGLAHGDFSTKMHTLNIEEANGPGGARHRIVPQNRPKSEDLRLFLVACLVRRLVSFHLVHLFAGVLTARTKSLGKHDLVMGYTKSIVPVVTSLTAAFVLSLMLITPSASACSLASPIPDWLSFVLNHGFANLNPDCTLTWRTGEVTDLNGNPIAPSPIYAFPQQYGIVFFFVGLVLSVIGIFLTIRSRRLNVKPHNSSDPVARTS